MILKSFDSLTKIFRAAKSPFDQRIVGFSHLRPFSSIGKNTFFVENPMTTEFDIVNGEIEYKGDNFYYCTLSKGKSTFKYGLSYIFFSEDDLEIMMTAPHFSQTKHTSYARLVPGKFNISKWFRPVNLEMLLYGNYFKMPEHEHMAYFQFLTDDKVELKRFELNETLRKISETCSTVSDWWKNVPLINRYDRFLKTKTNRLVMKEIRKQLVD